MPDNRSDRFFDSGSFVLFGMSRKKKNFAWSIRKALTEAGKSVFPLHPQAGKTNRVEFYSSVDSLPGSPDAGIVCLNLKKHPDMLPELKKSGLKKIWLQQGTYDNSIITELESAGLDCLKGCALMYIPGTSFPHRFHRFLHRLFSKGRN
jgi:predicted CoA-binding protein